MIKIDSDVDVRCAFCNRIGRRGYLTKEVYFGERIFCPGCYTILYGELDIDNPWPEKSEDWQHDFSDIYGKKNV